MKMIITMGFALLGAHTASAWSCETPGSDTKTLTKISLPNPEAVCNDGSQAAYYYGDDGRLAGNEDYNSQTIWLIYLGGGGQCWDSASCAARWNGLAYPHHDCAHSSVAKPCFMSSKDYPETCAKTGIFSTKSKLQSFARIHNVYVPYCSSDAYMGDGQMTVNLGSGYGQHVMHFRGLKIVESVLQDLVDKGLDRNAQVFFGGGSAGGRGAMAWLDYAREFLPTDHVRGFLDSAYYVDVKPLSSSFVGFQKITELATKNFNAVKLRDYNSECTEQHPGDQKWKCLFGQHLAPYVKTPYFLVTSQYDSWQLSHLVHSYDGIEKNPTYTAKETTYVNNFGLATRNALNDLADIDSSDFMFGIVGNHVTIFSAACYSHHESEKTLFWERKDASGNSVMEAFITFLTRKAQFIDKCTSYNCQCNPLPTAVFDPNEFDGTDSFSTTMASVTTTTHFPCSRVVNQTVCESTTCKGYHWHRSQCMKASSGGASTALLVTLLVLVLVMGIGIAVFLVIAKLRRKNGGTDNFLVIGEPV